MALLRKGQVYRCQNLDCRAEVEVKNSSRQGTLNPRCCCGAEMKRPYSKPALRRIDEKEAANLAVHFGGKVPLPLVHPSRL